MECAQGSPQESVIDQAILYPSGQRSRSMSAPPPYYHDAEPIDDDVPDVCLVVNALHEVRGNHNIVPTTPVLLDAYRGPIALIHDLSRQHAARNRSCRALRVNLTVNCGITIVGDRNIVGNVGIKAKLQGTAAVRHEHPTMDAAASLLPNATAGTKRKAQDDVSQISS